MNTPNGSTLILALTILKAIISAMHIDWKNFFSLEWDEETKVKVLEFLIEIILIILHHNPDCFTFP